MADRSPPPEPARANSFVVVDRPRAQRLQEFKYRFGQSVVFGLPVVALEWIGRSLGGPEADRWVTLFQALLAGWVVYVAATGMVVEGVVLLVARLNVRAILMFDLLAGLTAVSLYVSGLPRLVRLMTGATDAASSSVHFTACVLLLATWSGVRWAAQKRSSAK